MEKRFTNFLLFIIILLGGHGSVNAHINESLQNRNSVVFIKRNSVKERYLDKNHFFETFKRKACLFDNEETEENFSGLQKQLLKSTYFLNFLCSNKLAEYSVAFTKKVNYRKNFSLLSNKVYVLFEVFRI